MLECKNITISLKKDGRKIADGFSFTLKSGEKAVIIGEEGNGKSTLLRFLVQPEQVREYCDCEGEVITKCRLAYLPQTMEETYLENTVAEYFADFEVYLHMELLSKLGLSLEFLYSEQKLSTLSGGEKVKIQLARLLLEEPDILLLDEPTNDLDIETLEWLEAFLQKSRLPVLYISHDETLIENTANVILHMEQLIRKSKCRITVSHSSYREYLSHRRADFDHQEQVAQKQREDYSRQMEKWRKIYSRVEHEQKNLTRQDPAGGRLLKKKMHSVLSMGARFEREKESFLEFPEEEEAIFTRFDEDITVPSGKTVLDFSLDRLKIGEKSLSQAIKLFVSGNEHVGITGRNGAGKSTLLALLWEELKGRIDLIPAYMPQNYGEALDFTKSPIEFLAENRTKEEITRARSYLGCMRFTQEEMTGSIASLSGGQKAKVLFLDMVLKRANVLLLDEPTRNFSPLSGPVVRAALREFGGAIISVSHDRKYLEEVCDTVYELREEGLFLLET